MVSVKHSTWHIRFLFDIVQRRKPKIFSEYSVGIAHIHHTLIVSVVTERLPDSSNMFQCIALENRIDMLSSF